MRIFAVLLLVLVLPSETPHQVSTALSPGDFGYKHGEYHEWYKINMRNCCNGEDCRETRAEQRADGWHALVDGKLLRVPEQAIRRDARGVPIRGPNGFPHVCAGQRTKQIFCFVLPALDT